MSDPWNKFRTWAAFRQGLWGQSTKNPAEVLEKTGWARTVGSANPYLALYQRSGARAPELHARVAQGELQELPAARGCTYLVPRAHFGLALRLADRVTNKPLSAALVGLGVTEPEIDELKLAVWEALAHGPLEPNALKQSLGASVRSLGEAGKKIGQTTTLSLALGPLQSKGKIRRVAQNGRLDTERFAYERWDADQLPEWSWPEEQVNEAVARLFFQWTGGASLKQLQVFTGWTVAACKSAVRDLELKPLDGLPDWLILEDDADALDRFAASGAIDLRLVASLDNHFHLRRELGWLQNLDVARSLKGNGLADLPSHGVLRNGQLIGLWEFDPAAGEVVCQTFDGERDAGLLEEVERVTALIREDLGDFRSMSLDSPKSRQSRIQALKS